MRFLTLVLTFLASVAASAQWLATKYDFGAFHEEMGPVSCEFRWVNNTAEPVAIVAARASCGCTVPSYSHNAIAPGDTAVVTVTYNPIGRPGQFSKFVAVDLSIPDSRTKLTVTGTVVGSAASVATRFPVQCGPMQLSHSAVMMGGVDKGRLRTVMLDGYNRSDSVLEPVATGLPSYVEVVSSPKKVEPGQQFVYVVYFHSERCPLYGLVTDSMSLKPFPHAAGECVIPVMAMVNEDFSRMTPGQVRNAPVARLSSETLDFGTINPSDGPLTMSCTISNAGREKLIIRRAYTSDAGIKVSTSDTEIKKGKTATITVTVDPSQLRGALLNARIAVITNDPSAPTQTLRAVGTLAR